MHCYVNRKLVLLINEKQTQPRCFWEIISYLPSADACLSMPDIIMLLVKVVKNANLRNHLLLNYM